MALVKCREYGISVFDEVRNCHHCGIAHPASARTTRPLFLIALVAVALLPIVFLGIPLSLGNFEEVNAASASAVANADGASPLKSQASPSEDVVERAVEPSTGSDDEEFGGFDGSLSSKEIYRLIRLNDKAARNASPELRRYKKIIEPISNDLDIASIVYKCGIRGRDWLSDIDRIVRRGISNNIELNSLLTNFSDEELRFARDYVNLISKLKESWYIREDVQRSCDRLAKMPLLEQLDLVRSGAVSEVAPRARNGASDASAEQDIPSARPESAVDSAHPPASHPIQLPPEQRGLD